jgi:hypothetical protein
MTTIDPMADNFEPLSPYNYGMNNPVSTIDLNGMAAEDVIVADGVPDKEKPKPSLPPVEVPEVKVTGFRWPTWTYNIPIIGFGAKSGNDLADGKYISSLANFSSAIIEMFLWESAFKYKVPTPVAKYTQRELEGTVLTRLLKRLGLNTKDASAFFGWGDKTTITKSVSDFTKEQLLEAGWTKENLIDLGDAYRSLASKGQTNGGVNSAAVARSNQAFELAEHFFGN